MDEKPSAEMIGEAAVWMAMLRAPDRTTTVEKGFRHWLSAHPGHKAAFEAISTAWEETGALPKEPLPHLVRLRRAGFRQGFLQAAVAATVIVAVAVFMFYAYTWNSYATDIGEQRQFTLKDGSRITLNTATRIVVNFSDEQRTVRLKDGEALFEVARDPRRPFIVEAGDRAVTALGTSFVVRQDSSRLSVTLVEGKVAIVATGEPTTSVEQTSASSVSELRSEGSGQHPDLPVVEGSGLVLAPGQRATFMHTVRPLPDSGKGVEGEGATIRIDSPSVEKIIAWRTGHVDLAEVRLADAATEMNRYSSTKVTIEDPQTADILITGIFRAGDTANFANAIASTYDLTLQQSGEHIAITGKRGP